MNNKKIVSYAVIFVLFLSAYLLFANGRYGGDGLENYLTAESLILDRDLTIYDRPFGVAEMSYEVREDTDSEGNSYSQYGIGIPLLLVPFYAVGEALSKVLVGIPHDYITQFCVSLSNPIITALIAVVLFAFLMLLGFSPMVSFLSTLCFGFCTMSFIYTRSGFSEPAVCLFTLLALLFLYLYEKCSLARHILLASIFIGYTILIKKNSFLFLPLLILYGIHRSSVSKSIKDILKLWLAILLPLSLAIVAYLCWQHAIGTGLKSAADSIGREGITYGGNIIKGTYYYLFSPGKGFFIYNIPLLLALFGIRRMCYDERRLSLYFLVFMAVNIVFYAYHFKRGSIFSWGPRYLYPVTPLLCVFFAAFLKEARSVARRLLTAVFLVTGFLVQLPCLFVSFTKYLFFVKEKLNLQEYMVNFIPELSPVYGSWSLFISAIKRGISGVSLDFVYNPDSLFLEPVTKSLNGYDRWDIWWLNIASVSPRLIPAAVIINILLTAVIIISFAKLRREALDKQ